MVFVVPFSARRKIVVKRHGGHQAIREQPIRKVAAYESGASGNEIT
jgi:hypothetical protein